MGIFDHILSSSDFMSKLITKTNLEEMATGLHTKAKEYVDGVVRELDIDTLKDAIANKNNATVVVNTEAEIESANAEPKVGDLAFVIDSKKAYIYKGIDTLSVDGVPAGWTIFDEITNELDLVAYLKKEDAETTYRKTDTQITEADLDTDLIQKIDGKTDNDTVKGFINNNLQTLEFTQSDDAVTLTIGGADDVPEKTATLPLATSEEIQDILAGLV